MVARPFRHEAESRKLDFAVSLDPVLPRGMVTDSKRLQQVLKNLLSNAFKFTEHGSVTLAISVAGRGWSPDHPTLSFEPMVLSFEVSDTGIGIAPEKQKLIFEAFQQADASTSRKYGGTGLGLAISRELASLLGGEIQLRSAPGVGSTFTLYLPLKYKGPAGMQHSGAIEATTTNVPSAMMINNARLETVVEQVPDDRDNLVPDEPVLLIVEDDPHYARIMADLAHDKGLKVLVAMRGADALTLAREYKPYAVSLDVFLPDMLGWTVLSQLKQDPTTRHIPVQIVTLDEDRQHGLARGAFSFINKPTTQEGLEEALNRIKEYTKPRRKRLLVVEDNADERLSIGELLGHDDIEIVSVETGAEALSVLRVQEVDCVVLDLRLPDMSGFDMLEQMKEDAHLADLPVVVFTGRELSPEEDAQLHTMARSVVVKGVESPERLLDETALVPASRGRRIAGREAAHAGTAAQFGRRPGRPDRAARRRRRAQHFRFELGVGAARHAGADRHHRPRGDRNARHHARRGDRADGHHDAGNGRLRDHGGDPAESGLPPPADHRADREGDEGRPREMPGGRRFRLSGQAGQYRAALVGAADVAAPLSGEGKMAESDRINILLVDDQPAKLLSYEVILGELGENLLKANSAREAFVLLLKHDIAVVLIDVCMPELDGFELAAMIREHPRFQTTAIIFVSAIAMTDLDRVKGYEYGAVDYVPVPVVPELLRAKVRVFAELYRKTRELERLNAELERRVAERTAELAETNAELEQRVEERTAEREQALAQVHEMQKLDSLGQLTGGVAHDFNNLLMAILGNLEMLTRRMGEEPSARRLIDGASRAAERGAALTKRMLAFARRQELRPEPVDVARLVDEHERYAAAHPRPDGRDRRYIPTRSALWSRVDPNQLELALLNLALNARDAMPQGGKLTISAQLESVGFHNKLELPAGDFVLHHRQRYRHRHGRGDAEARRRAVLHHQRPRQGHGAGTFQRLWSRQTIGRRDRPHQ